MTLKVLTANRLRDGLVVYLAPDGSWSERIGEARIGAGEAASAELEAGAAAAVAAQRVVAPYLIEVSDEDGVIRALRYREEIRALGPTVRPELGTQATEGSESREG